YIVFCTNRNHLDEMVSHVYEWFGGVDTDMHIYKVYSEDPTASKEFLAFKEDNSEHLKLLYCIDMLNEGVHVNDIDGVVLFRPTVSPIIYKQQIGRALSANKNRKPVIFDVVNNFENLYSISTIQEEINLAVSYYRSLGQEERIVCDTFEIIDETRDCKELFENLEGSLSSTWEMYFLAAKQYYETRGNLQVPKSYVTDDGLTLGIWIGTQRRVRNGSIGGILTDDKIQRLDSIGMVWENVLEKRWEEGFRHAEEYFKIFGNLDVSAQYMSQDGYKLGTWINRNRAWYKNNSYAGVLDDERVSRLNDIGMIWSHNNTVWEKNYLSAAAYFNEHKNLDVPRGYVDKNGIKLGVWTANQKNAYRKGTLTDEQIERLEMIGMQWMNKQDRQWMEIYAEAAEFYRKQGNLDVPLSYRTKNGIVLRKWLYNQRTNKRLSKERRALLDSIGMKWEEKDSWTERYELVKRYFEQHGNLDISQDYKTDNNIWLGKWLYEQKKNKAKLTEKQIQQLEAIGIDWRLRSEALWDEKYAEAADFLKKNGHLHISREYSSECGLDLNLWMYKQKRLFNEKRLNVRQIVRFGELLKEAGQYENRNDVAGAF
ncbi:MAG: Helicase associated domain protein, partial [bacterium]|nr:Helicase associated domain protein [bacterium]